MRALLLAAGLGTRLRPLTETVPKCLVPIHGLPLLDYWLALVFAAGVERTLLNTHWLPEAVRAHVAGSPWRDRIDLVHEEILLGTGGTLKANRAYFGAEPILVAHADNLTAFDLPEMIRRHEARPAGCLLTMLAFETDDPRSCGILELGPDDVLQAFYEKVENPPGNLANGAVYIIAPDLADRIAALDRDVVDLSTEVIPALMGRILVVPTTAYHRDIGTLASLEQANRDFPRLA
jgi:mannose-1-phosphate guanylyltransferase